MCALKRSPAHGESECLTFPRSSSNYHAHNFDNLCEIWFLPAQRPWTRRRHKFGNIVNLANVNEIYFADTIHVHLWIILNSYAAADDYSFLLRFFPCQPKTCMKKQHFSDERTLSGRHKNAKRVERFISGTEELKFNPPTNPLPLSFSKNSRFLARQKLENVFFLCFSMD